MPTDVALEQASAVASLSASFLRGDVVGSGSAAPGGVFASTEFAVHSHPDTAPDPASEQDDGTDPVPGALTERHHEVMDVPCVPMGTFLVGVQLRSRFRRLRRMGDCSNRPGVDFKPFELRGLDEPAPSKYTAKCKHCFKAEAAQPMLGDGSS